MLLALLIYNEIYQISTTINLPESAEAFEVISNQINSFLSSLPGEPSVSETNLRDSFNEVLNRIPSLFIPVSNYLLNLTTHTIIFIILFSSVLSGYKTLIKYIIQASPLSKKSTERFLDGVWTTSQDVMKSTVLVGIIQGVLTFIALVVLQIDLAFFWSILTTVAAILPIGGGFILFPISLILLITGEITKAIILFIFTFILVNIIDSILRPTLLSDKSVLPQVVTLLGILGGIISFGIVGILIGPIILTVLKISIDLAAESEVY